MARVSNYLEALVDQLIKAWIVCGTVYDDGMRLKRADHLVQTVFKTITVNVFARTAADRAYTYDTVFLDPSKTVAVCFFRTPTDVVDDGESVSSEPVAH